VWYAIHVHFIFSVFFWTNVQSKRTTRAEPEDHLWSADHSFRHADVADYDTIKCLWNLKRIKWVTLLWYIMIHGLQNIKIIGVVFDWLLRWYTTVIKHNGINHIQMFYCCLLWHNHYSWVTHGVSGITRKASLDVRVDSSDSVLFRCVVYLSSSYVTNYRPSGQCLLSALRALLHKTNRDDIFHIGISDQVAMPANRSCQPQKAWLQSPTWGGTLG
jgi:hypothetical protein